MVYYFVLYLDYFYGIIGVEIKVDIQVKTKIINIDKNGEIHCCKRSDNINKEIYAIIKLFGGGNKPEFDVIFREECAGYEVNQSFDNVYEFVNEFKKIINAVDHVSELANSLVIF